MEQENSNPRKPNRNYLIWIAFFLATFCIWPSIIGMQRNSEKEQLAEFLHSEVSKVCDSEGSECHFEPYFSPKIEHEFSRYGDICYVSGLIFINSEAQAKFEKNFRLNETGLHEISGKTSVMMNEISSVSNKDYPETKLFLIEMWRDVPVLTPFEWSLSID